jgi:hypothetical protein
MVLISIHPFALRKLLLVVVAFLCLSALCLADPVLMVRRYSSPGERPGNLNIPVENLEQPLVSSITFADENEKSGQRFDSLSSECPPRPVEPGSFDRWEVNSFSLGNPAYIDRSTVLAPRGLEDVPFGFWLRRT